MIEPDEPADVEKTAAEWDEVRLQGQPDPILWRDGSVCHVYPRYDFTFRSDRASWASLPSLLAAANAAWTDVTITQRHVEQLTSTFTWDQVDAGALLDRLGGEEVSP